MQRVIGGTMRSSGSAQRPPLQLLQAARAWGLRAVPALLAGLLLLALGLAARQLALGELEHEGIEVKALGPQTPADFGAPFETVTLPVGDRLLQARLVQAGAPEAAAVLIFHGNGESVADWARVQARLRAAGIASMVFDYSGFGASTGQPSVAHLHEDAQAAYRLFIQRWPRAQARVALGHSLGNAVMLDALPAMQSGLNGFVVHAGFTSAREMATRTGLASPWLAGLLPNLWDNETALAQAGALPALVLHSDADEVIPQAMGLRLAEAAGTRARFVGLHGLRHDSLYEDLPAEEWQPIVDFINGSAGGSRP